MKDYEADEILWPIVKEIPSFWESLEWTNDGRLLWNFIRRYDPVILSAPTKHDVRSFSGKMHWIQQNLDMDTHWVFTKAKHKSLIAEPGRILIDDFEPNIRKWKEAGGLGILHKNAEETIRILEVLL